MEYAQLGWRVGAVLLPGSGSGISFPRLRLYPRMPGFCRRLSISNGGVLRCVVGPVVTRCSGVYETGRSFSSPPNFRRSVLSCIDALDRERRLIFLRFSRDVRIARFSAAQHLKCACFKNHGLRFLRNIGAFARILPDFLRDVAEISFCFVNIRAGYGQN